MELNALIKQRLCFDCEIDTVISADLECFVISSKSVLLPIIFAMRKYYFQVATDLAILANSRFFSLLLVLACVFPEKGTGNQRRNGLDK